MLPSTPWALPLPVVVTSSGSSAPPFISAPSRATPLAHIVSLATSGSSESTTWTLTAAVGWGGARVALPLALPCGAVHDVLGSGTLPLRVTAHPPPGDACALAVPSVAAIFASSLRASTLLRSGDAGVLTAPRVRDALDGALLGDATLVAAARLPPECSIVPLWLLLVAPRAASRITAPSSPLPDAVHVLQAGADARATLADAVASLLAAAEPYCTGASAVCVAGCGAASTPTHEAVLHGAPVISVEGMGAEPLITVAATAGSPDGWLYVSLRRRQRRSAGSSDAASSALPAALPSPRRTILSPPASLPPTTTE